VAEHEFLAIDANFRIWLNALPAVAARDHGVVVVTNDKMLPAMQGRQ
jgi:hypothetical protein